VNPNHIGSKEVEISRNFTNRIHQQTIDTMTINIQETVNMSQYTDHQSNTEHVVWKITILIKYNSINNLTSSIQKQPATGSHYQKSIRGVANLLIIRPCPTTLSTNHIHYRQRCSWPW